MTTLKRVALLVVVLTVLLTPQPASLLETEVRHGESPKWSGPTVGRYAVTVVDYGPPRPRQSWRPQGRVAIRRADEAPRRDARPADRLSRVVRRGVGATRRSA